MSKPDVFKPGDKVRLLLGNDVGMSAKAGATGIVKTVAAPFLHVVWDRTNPLCLAQMDGGYYSEYFEIIDESADKKLADEYRRLLGMVWRTRNELIRRGYSIAVGPVTPNQNVAPFHDVRIIKTETIEL